MSVEATRSAAARVCGALAIAALVCPAVAVAIAPVETPRPGQLVLSAPIVTPELKAAPSLSIFDMGSPDLTDLAPAKAFLALHGHDWEVRWDNRSERPHLIQGSGVPVIPGRGNDLRPQDVGLSAGERPGVEHMERRMRAFMDEFPELFRIPQEQLVLDLDSTRPYGPDDYYWTVVFQQVVAGVPVEGAEVFFRVNHGNIIQFGTLSVADVGIATAPSFGPEEVAGRVFTRLGLSAADLGEIVEPGRLFLLPTLLDGERPGWEYAGVPGLGYQHRLVYELVFRRPGDLSTYRALVDAHSGDVLEIGDVNRYATATVEGGVYPESSNDSEQTLPFPHATVDEDGTSKETDASGNYEYDGGTATVMLDGRYTNIDDDCGNISLSDSSDGNLDFGTSGGTDCDTPGVGGDGNTHSARTGFYHLTTINRDVESTLSSPPGWLNNTLTANMNINDVCNAFWDGSTVNFFRSGGGCNNTGEISDVFLHEWGHGLDDNLGSSSPDNGAGEAYADTIAFIYNGNSCIGENFRSTPCNNCGSCTGVRDMGPFSEGGSATIASPAEVEDNSGIDCDRFACPYFTPSGFAYQGPMEYEGHCESYIGSTANWDTRSKIGSGTFKSLWYGSAGSLGASYRITSGGTCNPSADVDGCGAANWYTVFIGVDDDNGDLSDGTPNGCDIFDAFDAHGIACGDEGPGCGDCTPTGDTETNCSDGKDDDCDGLIDCQDSDCSGDPACDCTLGVKLRDDVLQTGDLLFWKVGLEHLNPLAVDTSFQMWIENEFGDVVAAHESGSRTFTHGDRVKLEGSLRVPADQPPGDYRLIVQIEGMNQGVAQRERPFTIMP